MNSITIVNIIRFLVLVLFQVLVLRQINFGPIFGEYLRVFMYPLFLLLLPVRLSTEALMLIGFGTGLVIDAAYDTFGVHASVAIGLMALRRNILNRLLPKGGYNQNKGLTPDSYGWSWFMRYIFFSFLLFSFWLSILEVFQLWRVGTIVIRAILTIPISIFFIFIGVQLLNPRH